MSSEDKDQRTEQPTQKKLDDAKRKGGAPRSAELSTIVVLIVAFAVLRFCGRHLFEVLAGNSATLFSSVAQTKVTEESVQLLLSGQIVDVGLALMPFGVALLLGNIAINVVQGASISTERLELKFEKLDPIAGFGRLFRLESLVEIPKSILKIALVSFVAYRVIKGELPVMTVLSESSPAEIFSYFGRVAFKMIVDTCMLLLTLAAADTLYVRWRYLQNLKMTKQEVRDEAKESEGDPKAKANIRKMQFQMARRRMEQLIPQADALVTNPTHFAVAIKYDATKMAAPIVLLKGVDQSALKMREIARRHSVPIIENRPLARELHATVKEGAPIPEKLYAAVAEVLAYVFRLKGRL